MSSEERGLPPQKIKVLMQENPAVGRMDRQAPQLMGQAAQAFLQHLVREAWAIQTGGSSSGKKSELELASIHQAIQTVPDLDFLVDLTNAADEA